MSYSPIRKGGGRLYVKKQATLGVHCFRRAGIVECGKGEEVQNPQQLGQEI